MPDERTAAREGRGGAGDEDWEGGDYMDVSQRVAKNRERGEEEGGGGDCPEQYILRGGEDYLQWYSSLRKVKDTHAPFVELCPLKRNQGKRRRSFTFCGKIDNSPFYFHSKREKDKDNGTG